MEQKVLHCLATIWVVLFMLVMINAKLCELPESVKDIHNSCLKSKYHKVKPGPEPLENQCEPWKENSCCTANSSRQLQKLDGTWYNFSFNHCKPLSELCSKYFIQDLCFLECSTNIGPWMVDVDMNSRKERHFNVPLCKKDCDNWWEACKHDLTCRDNWMKGFVWETGTNVCPVGHQCKSFEFYFKNASNFCQQVWDESFKVVPNSEPCMTLGMDGNIMQNKQVTELYLNEKYCSNHTSQVYFSTIFIFLFAFSHIILFV